MDIHPVADLLPLMLEEEYRALLNSIRENGLREPVVTIQTEEGVKILDGRNRFRACEELCRVPTMRAYVGPKDDDSLIAYVLDANLHRRHLIESQRAMVAAKIATYRHGGDRRSNQEANLPLETQSTAAEKVNVSARSVKSAVAVLKNGTSALATTVSDGTVPVSVAAKVAKMPEAKQQQFVEECAKGKQAPHQVLACMNRADRKQEILDRANETPLDTGKRHHIIAADPAWPYEQQLMGHTDRGVENHYPTMTMDAICALPVAKIAHDDAVLFLWVPACLIQEGLRVVSAWGFVYKTHIVWDKMTIGIGFHVRNCHELLFIATRGKIPLQEPCDTPPSIIRAPREEHSKKPDIFMEWIERMYPGYSKIELFSRRSRPGWTAWGWEAKGSEEE